MTFSDIQGWMKEKGGAAARALSPSKLGLKKLDIYIAKKFFTTFFIAIILIIGIIIIFDISEKIDDFVSKQAPLKSIIVDYYFNFIPYYINMFSPLFIFISVIFFTSRMAANSEIVAMLSCGVSFHRLMVPYLVTAAVLALMSLGLNMWVIPNANAKRLAFETTYVKKRARPGERNIHYQIAPGKFVYVESFSKWNNTAYRFTLESIENNRLVSKLSAEQAVWDSTFGGWTLKKYFLREYPENTLSDKVTVGSQIDTVIELTVTDFYLNHNTVKELPEGQLNQLIKTQKLRGDANVKYSLYEKNQRSAVPFSAFILTIIGVALSSRKKRGGIGWNLTIGIALSFSYILFLRFSEMFVYTGTLPPFLALWLPNLLFAIVAAVLYRIAPK